MSNQWSKIIYFIYSFIYSMERNLDELTFYGAKNRKYSLFMERTWYILQWGIITHIENSIDISNYAAKHGPNAIR